jgi:hypothetical protein
MDRYARQRRLPEVGDAGQTRLGRSALGVAGSGDAARAEADYLVRAGIGRVTPLPDQAPAPFAHAAAFQFAAPCALAAGAWRALAQIRRELGMDPA